MFVPTFMKIQSYYEDTHRHHTTWPCFLTQI